MTSPVYRSGGIDDPVTELVDHSGVVANAAAVTTIHASPGVTSYLSGFAITGLGATAASTIQVTITGCAQTLSYTVEVPAGVATAINPLIIEFSRPIPAAAPNTAIAVTAPAFGAGNVNAVASSHGYQK